MAYSEVKLKGNGDKVFPCFRLYWIGKISNVHPYGIYYTAACGAIAKY
jgi:hypothetical protein